MEQVKVSARSKRTVPLLFVSFLILIGGLYSTVTQASTLPTGQQLAYFVGYHYAPGQSHIGPNRHYHHQPRQPYWTGWRHTSPRCQKRCLVDRRTGHIIRCTRVCRH